MTDTAILLACYCFAMRVQQRLAAELDEPLEVIRYERLSPLTLARGPVRSLAALRPGDCVVGFSRQRLHELKGEIEAATSLRCCVVYGSLPPAVRQEQARLFNDADSGYSVLVASDAVGMGLNLAIKRIVFSRTDKYDGIMTRPLTGAEVT
jgi:ATP-dependent RNA helicase SUPV3L1/SUV3